MSNRYADNARSRKVVAILGVLPRGRTQMENDVLAQFLESLSPDQRKVYEVFARVNACSAETWGMVFAAVRARHVPGDGGALNRRQDVRRPDFTEFIRRMHNTHGDRDICVPCEMLADELDKAFDAGVAAAARAVGL